MAQVQPFRGIRYAPGAAEDPGQLLCPPYDIGPERQQALRALHPCNAIRLEVPEATPEDTPEDNRYTRAQDTFRRWLEAGVLVRDPVPAFYLLRQHFQHGGVEQARLALVAAVRLEEYEKGGILPHEHTMPGPIQDRLSLLRACRVNFSPLMVLYRDPHGKVGDCLRAAAQQPPTLVTHDADGHGVEVWVLSDANFNARLQGFLERQALYMADGHHRYEAALSYRDEVRRTEGHKAGGGEGCDYVMLALIAFDDSALVVLPYHRLLRGLGPALLQRVWSRLRELFEVSPCHVDGAHPGALLEQVAHGAALRPTIGLLQAQATYLLTLREGLNPARLGPLAPCEGWLLERALRPVLGQSLGEHIVYLPDEGQALEKVCTGEGQMAFFLRAIPLELFQSVVKQGQRLPPKSTNFYPKLPTGLVFRTLEGEL